jgi:hypothetical protein
MIKKIYSYAMIFAVAVAFFLIFCPQMGKSESPGTLKLLSGEVVCDLRGEWSALYEFFGTCMQWPGHKGILEIKQEGDRLVAIKVSGGGLSGKGDEVIRGQLDEKGFKKVERYIPGWGWTQCKGGITSDCRKMVLDHEGCAKITLERK